MSNPKTSKIENPEPPKRVRRTGSPTIEELSLFENLRRSVWVIEDLEAYTASIEEDLL